MLTTDAAFVTLSAVNVTTCSFLPKPAASNGTTFPVGPATAASSGANCAHFVPITAHNGTRFASAVTFAPPDVTRGAVLVPLCAVDGTTGGVAGTGWGFRGSTSAKNGTTIGVPVRSWRAARTILLHVVTPVAGKPCGTAGKVMKSAGSARFVGTLLPRGLDGLRAGRVSEEKRPQVVPWLAAWLPGTEQVVPIAGRIVRSRELSIDRVPTELRERIDLHRRARARAVSTLSPPREVPSTPPGSAGVSPAFKENGPQARPLVARAYLGSRPATATAASGRASGAIVAPRRRISRVRYAPRSGLRKTSRVFAFRFTTQASAIPERA